MGVSSRLIFYKSIYSAFEGVFTGLFHRVRLGVLTFPFFHASVGLDTGLFFPPMRILWVPRASESTHGIRTQSCPELRLRFRFTKVGVCICLSSVALQVALQLAC